MDVLNQNILHEFGKKHSNSRKPLATWLAIFRESTWATFSEVRNTFRSADVAGSYTIFDIGGNNYRAITLIRYPKQQVIIDKVMTHAEYDRWTP